MNLPERKYKLIEKLLKVEEETTLYQLENILNNDDSDDFWNNLPAEVQQAIEKGIEQSDNGQTKSHDEVMSEVKNKYPVK